MFQYILIAILLCGLILVIYNIATSKILLKGITPSKLMYPICIIILMVCVFINYNLTKFRPISIVTFVLALTLVILIAFSKEGICEKGVFCNGVLIKWKDISKISITEENDKTILGYTTIYQKHKVMHFNNVKRKAVDDLLPKKKVYR